MLCRGLNVIDTMACDHLDIGGAGSAPSCATSTSMNAPTCLYLCAPSLLPSRTTMDAIGIGTVDSARGLL